MYKDSSARYGVSLDPLKEWFVEFELCLILCAMLLLTYSYDRHNKLIEETCKIGQEVSSY